ncbi:DUF2242 domain-containing protein [Pseudomonas sp. FSL R10-0399]|uniref:DUF2242 domain-containing protein n=1 Tax=Pseudomonas sp. FSL R10-0399 TaxID=2662194 RepID=UPI001297898F|nr:DUF2242 domain-containing protein [Pseudomonas sp. FSL R10-0399]MQT59172.1 DUF2242 domain-containing protein [Pseudomonas sp. FSL R10-0399]
MPMSFSLRTAVVALCLAGLAGCSSNKPTIYDHESFDDSGTFSRNYPVSDKVSCEAARRALLSQGYIITSNDPKMISGHKSFQQSGESHLEISFNVVCADDGGSAHHATMFANALLDRYALKKVNNSASLGVGVLGSVSMPIGSSDDSMVKVASETVSSPDFYDRYFSLVEAFLPKDAKKVTPTDDKPKAELGVPEAAVKPQAVPVAPVAPVEAPAAPATPAAPEPAPTPVAEPAVEATSSKPVAPPADLQPIVPIETPVTPAPVPAITPAIPAAVTPPAAEKSVETPSEKTTEPAAPAPTSTITPPAESAKPAVPAVLEPASAQ